MSSDGQKFSEAMDLYKETFGEGFPIMVFKDKSFDEMIEIALQYVKSGEPYFPEYLKGDELEFYKAEILYWQAFGEHFPRIWQFRRKTFKEKTEIALQCIKDGKPYKHKSKLPKGAVL